MSSVAELEYVRDLLECVSIDRVISVDDRHAPGPEVVVNTAREFTSVQRAELLGLPGDDEALAEDDVFEQRLESLWDEYGAAERTTLVQSTQKMAGDSLVADDTEALGRLGQLMPDHVFEQLSKADWEQRREDIVESGHSVLVLFDRDFRAEGGQKHDGEQLLADLQRASQDKPIWTGLLTHTVPPEAEHQEFLKLEDTVDLRRTVLISKARVTAGEFSAYLRLTLLAPLLHRLVTIVSEKIAETHEQAMTDAKAVLPVELESMVFGASQVEGVWEPDTLVLLFGLVQRDNARAKIWDDPEVHRLTGQVRCLGRVDAGPPVADEQAKDEPREAADPGTAPRFYQRRQIYEDPATVNKLHLPIECGDVFVDVTRPSKKWIVIAQPCDLVVRSNGLRGDYPIAHVAMSPIEREPKRTPPESDFRLPYFDDQGRHYVTKLGQVRYQRLWLLDLAVFHNTGHALLCLDDDTPPNMLEGWGARHAQLKGESEKLIKICAANASGLDRALGLETPPDAGELHAIANAVREGVAADHAQPPFTTAIRPDTAQIDAGCRRVARLSTEYAQALLTRWGAHLSRPVLPYDLTRRPDR